MWLISTPLEGSYHDARDRVIAQFETQYLNWLVIHADGNMSKAARIAGVDRTTLYRLMERHGLRRSPRAGWLVEPVAESAADAGAAVRVGHGAEAAELPPPASNFRNSRPAASGRATAPLSPRNSPSRNRPGLDISYAMTYVISCDMACDVSEHEEA